MSVCAETPADDLETNFVSITTALPQYQVQMSSRHLRRAVPSGRDPSGGLFYGALAAGRGSGRVGRFRSARSFCDQPSGTVCRRPPFRGPNCDFGEPLICPQDQALLKDILIVASYKVFKPLDGNNWRNQGLRRLRICW
jgi:hypothetical protein